MYLLYLIKHMYVRALVTIINGLDESVREKIGGILLGVHRSFIAVFVWRKDFGNTTGAD